MLALYVFACSGVIAISSVSLFVIMLARRYIGTYMYVLHIGMIHDCCSVLIAHLSLFFLLGGVFEGGPSTA